MYEVEVTGQVANKKEYILTDSRQGNRILELIQEVRESLKIGDENEVKLNEAVDILIGRKRGY